jgi:general secretion pathway protein D
MNNSIRALSILTFFTLTIFAQDNVVNIEDINNKKHKIRFSYDKTDLTNVINDIAAEAEINIILPTGKDAITGQLTFTYPKKITVGQAWNFLGTILETAGYSIVPNGRFFTIVPNSQDPNRRPLPLFMGVHPDHLPNTDERIRYVYFFSNINLANANQKKEIMVILQDMLPTVDTKNLNQQLDVGINAAILNSTARRLRSAMKIIATLDETGFTETAVVVTLKHTQATFVEKLFKGDQKNPGLIGSSNERFPFFGEQSKKKKAERYFSEATRVTALPHTNQIAILGKKDAVAKVLDFIEKYIDIPLDPKGKAKSIIHVYDLNYLDAQKFKSVLDSVLKTPQGTQATGKMTIGGVDFSNVIIAAEQEVAAKTVQGGIQAVQQQNQQQNGAQESKAYVGGNRLIIAAREREWQMIEELIQQLDSAPQPQVALDVLIVDLSLDDIKALGTQLRDKQLSPFFKNVNFQSAHLSNPWLNFDGSNPAQVLDPPGIAADLLHPELTANIAPELANPSTSPVNIAASTNPLGGASPFTETGSFFLSASEKNCEYPSQQFSNPIWFLLQALQTSTDAHIVSRPFVVTANNTKADIQLSQERLVVGDASVENNGPAIVNRKNLTAALQVSVTPRVSRGKNVNLTLTINSNQFVALDDLSNDTIQTRTITTNANVQDGNVLVLGGLSQDREDELVRETPILGKIPVLGYFFKKKRKAYAKRSLLVFIVPRIIRPLSTYAYRSLISPYTHDKLDLARKTVENDRYFGDTRDPISRAFFGTDETDDSIQQIDDFVNREVFKAEHIQQPIVSEQSATNPRQMTAAQPIASPSTINAPLSNNSSENNQPIDLSKSAQLKNILAGAQNPLEKK